MKVKPVSTMLLKGILQFAFRDLVDIQVLEFRSRVRLWTVVFNPSAGDHPDLICLRIVESIEMGQIDGRVNIFTLCIGTNDIQVTLVNTDRNTNAEVLDDLCPVLTHLP